IVSPLRSALALMVAPACRFDRQGAPDRSDPLALTKGRSRRVGRATPRVVRPTGVSPRHRWASPRSVVVTTGNCRGEVSPSSTQKSNLPMRKLNLPFLIGLLAVAAVLGVGYHFVHAYQVRRNASALLDRADRAEAGKNLDQAEQALRDYLDLRREDGPAWK